MYRKGKVCDIHMHCTNIFGLLLHTQIFMVLAWMLIIPAGILVARFGRTLFVWFPTHRAIQYLAGIFILVASWLAFAAVASTGQRHFQSRHAKSGIGLLILHGQQMLLGTAAHWHRARTGRRWLGYLHMPLGIILMGGLAWSQTKERGSVFSSLPLPFSPQPGPSTPSTSVSRCGCGVLPMRSATLSTPGQALLPSSTSQALPFFLARGDRLPSRVVLLDMSGMLATPTRGARMASPWQT
jgi:hypothetical protein